MRTCPFDNCAAQIQETRFACPKHWFSLNKDQQARIWHSYRQYIADKIDLDQLRRAQREVLDEAQGKKAVHE